MIQRKVKLGIALVLATILFLIAFSNWSVSQAANNKLLILLDPGHGGYQPGTVYNGVAERDVTLKVARYLKQYLEEYSNVEVALTHNGLPSNEELEIFDRGVMAREIGADLLISLHFNAGASHGAEVYVTANKCLDKYNKNSTLLAQSILGKISNLGIRNNGVKTRQVGDVTDVYSDGTRADYDGPIRYAMRGTMIDNGVTSILKNGQKVQVPASTSANVQNGEGIPGILIEHCYLQNDYEYINTEEKIQKLARADCDGIVEYYGLVKKDATVAVTGINLNKSTLTMVKNSSITLNATVSPNNATNKNVKWSSSNEKVAKVDNNGKVTGVADSGTAVIKATTVDGNKVAQCTVTLTSKKKEDTYEIKELKKQDQYISNVSLGSTIQQLKQKVTTSGALGIKITDAKGKERSNTESVKNNDRLIITYGKDNVILEEHIITIYGDLDCDGEITSIDLLVLQRHVLGYEKLDKNVWRAGNIEKDGQEPTSIDLLMIQRHVLGYENIKQ